jgi:hypothetical protein
MNFDKLVLFGDSYSIEYEYDEHCWYNKLSQLLLIPKDKILNFAKKGSSFEYSTLKLFDYLHSDAYSKKDLICFVPTAFGRNPIVGTSIDPESAFFLKEFLAGRYDKKIRFHAHYYEHKEFYQTLFNFASEELFQSQMFNVAMTLKLLPNMTLMIPAFNNYFAGNKHLVNTDNFLLVDLELFKIDRDEIDSAEYYDLRYFFKGDPRYCHMTKTNNLILANQLHEAVINQDAKFIYHSGFKSKIIKLSPQFESLYEQELQPSWIHYKQESAAWYAFGKTSFLR